MVSLLYINTGNIPSCKTLAHSRLSPFASTMDLIAPVPFLSFTTFLLHYIVHSLFIQHILIYLNRYFFQLLTIEHDSTMRILFTHYQYLTLNLHLLSNPSFYICLLYTSDAADERSSVDLGGRR